MNSSVAFCASAATCDVSAVRTTIPSCAVSVQAACGFGGPGSTWHEAHAAGPDGRPEPRLVTEHGNLDAGRERRLDEPGALRHLDGDAVDRERDCLRGTHAARLRTSFVPVPGTGTCPK